MPPLAEMNWPVNQRLFSEATNRTMSAISLGVPNLSAALVAGSIGPATSWIYSALISVGTGPAATELTVIPWDLPNYKTGLGLDQSNGK